MNKYYASKSGLFLIELIMSIFFFIITAAVVLKLFVSSHIVGQETISINNALYYTQNISELFLGNSGSFDAVRNEYSDVLCTSLSTDNGTYHDDDSRLLLLFDNDWKIVSASQDAEYIVYAVHENAENNSDGYLSTIDIYVHKFPDNINWLNNDVYKSALLENGFIHHQTIKKYIIK